MDKKYRTNLGHVVRILCIDANGNFPVVALVTNKLNVSYPLMFTEYGTCHSVDDRDYDLVEYSEWDDVQVDTLIKITINGTTYIRYFAKYENGIVYHFSGGASSYTNETKSLNCIYAKNAEVYIPSKKA